MEQWIVAASSRVKRRNRLHPLQLFWVTGSYLDGFPPVPDGMMREKGPRSALRPPSQRDQSSGFSPASIFARRDSRNGGKDSASPMVSNGSSTANPGVSEAISNRLPPGSRK